MSETNGTSATNGTARAAPEPAAPEPAPKLADTRSRRLGKLWEQ